VLRKKKTGFLSVYNDNLSFVSFDQNGYWECMESIPLTSIFDTDFSIDLLPKRLNNYDFTLLVVPDFWFGHFVYSFHSNNKSDIESFITRKLKLEFPKYTAIQNLFSYKIVKNEKGERNIITLFLQEPKAGELCNRLAQYNLRPSRITAPALLWNQRLIARIDSFENMGVGLIYLFGRECLLLFYNRGNFLFSRTISLPEPGEDNTAQLEALSYETNQSVYHFSQRIKKELDKIFFISGKETNVEQLSEMLGREVTLLDSSAQSHVSSEDLITQVGLVADFHPDELFPPQDLPGVSERTIVKEMELKRIQFAGIIIGLVILFILGLESGFLKNMQEHESSSFSAVETDPKHVIGQYNEALDVLLVDAERDEPIDIIGRLAVSLPENIEVELIEIELEPSLFISFGGIIKAYDANDFSASLRALVENVNVNLKYSNPLSMDDVDIEINGDGPSRGYRDYHIFFRLDLI
jgi:hypothetical protein